MEKTRWKHIQTVRKQPIGNIHLHNVKSVVNAGADCIAVVSEICGATEPHKTAYELKNEILK